MTEKNNSDRPSLNIISKEKIKSIHNASLYVLENIGIQIDNTNALEILSDAGADIDTTKNVVKFPEYLVEESLTKPPSSIQLYDRSGTPSMVLAGDEVHYNPGSSALNILDRETLKTRLPISKDLKNFVRLVDGLEYIHAQSTAMVVSDVPTAIVDRYRLYIVLKNTSKPIVTGAFTIDGIMDMHKMLIAIRGSEKRLKNKPLAIFDACPSPPLKWSEITSQNLIDCSKLGLPVEIIAMPQLGATSPATIAGSIVQHNAETLSGIVLTQIVNPKSPVIYGGSPTTIDMRFGTACLGSIEVWMQCSAYAQLGKFYNLPTHGYMGLSDAKILDMQAGLEAGMGLVLAGLAGINNVAGPGMLSFENCQSLEKVIVDNEICGMVYRLLKGIKVNDETLAKEILSDVGPGGHFLSSSHTTKWFPLEEYIPSLLIDKLPEGQWQSQGSPDTFIRAKKQVDKILKEHQPEPLEDEISQDLDDIARAFSS